VFEVFVEVHGAEQPEQASAAHIASKQVLCSTIAGRLVMNVAACHVGESKINPDIAVFHRWADRWRDVWIGQGPLIGKARHLVERDSDTPLSKFDELVFEIQRGRAIRLAESDQTCWRERDHRKILTSVLWNSQKTEPNAVQFSICGLRYCRREFRPPASLEA
jgi:hypothetical protein